MEEVIGHHFYSRKSYLSFSKYFRISIPLTINGKEISFFEENVYIECLSEDLNPEIEEDFEQGILIDGQKEGKWISLNFPFKKITFYHRNLPNGPFLRFNSKHLVRQGFMKNDKPCKMWREWDENALVKERLYDEDLSYFEITYHSDGWKSSTKFINRSQNSASITFWYPNGHKQSEGSYKGSKRNGPWISYQENGFKDEEGFYENEQKIGIWIFYDEKQNIQRTGIYQNNQPVGIWDFYRDGVKYVERDYDAKVSRVKKSSRKIDHDS